MAAKIDSDLIFFFSPLERLLRSLIVVLMRADMPFFKSIYLTGYKFRLISYFVSGVKKIIITTMRWDMNVK